jgi:hypothetical protein
MPGANRNILAILVAITMIVSLVGTMAAVAVMSGYGGSQQSHNTDSGKVSVYLTSAPVPVTGKVTVYLGSSEEDG